MEASREAGALRHARRPGDDDAASERTAGRVVDGRQAVAVGGGEG
jgi:hypothetical protein